MEDALRDELSLPFKRSNSLKPSKNSNNGFLILRKSWNYFMNTRDQVFEDMKEALFEQIKQKDQVINEIQKNFNEKVEALTIDMSIL